MKVAAALTDPQRRGGWKLASLNGIQPVAPVRSNSAAFANHSRIVSIGQKKSCCTLFASSVLKFFDLRLTLMFSVVGTLFPPSLCLLL